jgi:peroxiredoxin
MKPASPRPIKRSRRRLAAVILGAMGIGFLGVGMRCRSGQARTWGRPPAIGEAAPEFELPDTDGYLHRLSRLRGRRVLLLFFCGCATCRALAPEWEKIHRADPEVAVFGIAAVGSAHVRQFRRATHTTFPILFDANYGVASRYGSLECPRSWLVDESGTVAWTGRPQDGRAAVAKALRRYLLAPVMNHGASCDAKVGRGHV